MLLLVLVLVLIAFGLLVVALLSGSVMWAWVSVGVSVTAAVVLLVDWLQRRSAARAGDDVAGAQAAAPTTAASAEVEPVTEFLPVVPSSPPAVPPGAADEPAARNGIAPEGSESRYDPGSDVSRTAVLPAATPSGSADRPSGAAPDSAPFGANPSLSVTDSGSDRPTGPDEDAAVRVADRASGSPPAAEQGSGSGSEERSDAPALDLFTRDPSERAEQPTRVPAPPDPTWSSSDPDPDRSEDPARPGVQSPDVESTVVVQARPPADSTAASREPIPEDAAAQDAAAPDVVRPDTSPHDVPPQDAAPQDWAPQDAAPQDAAPPEAAPGNSALGPPAVPVGPRSSVAPQNAVPQDAIPQNADPQDAAPQNAGTPGEARQDAARQDVAPVAAGIGAPASPVEPRSADARPGGTPAETPGAGALAGARAPTEGPGADTHTVPPLDPDGELPEEPHDGSTAALVAGLEDEVVVVDEQPRYHVTGCRSLSGSPLIPLPVREAVELGFSPCGWCAPARTLADRHPTVAAKVR